MAINPRFSFSSVLGCKNIAMGNKNRVRQIRGQRHKTFSPDSDPLGQEEERTRLATKSPWYPDFESVGIPELGQSRWSLEVVVGPGNPEKPSMLGSRAYLCRVQPPARHPKYFKKTKFNHVLLYHLASVHWTPNVRPAGLNLKKKKSKSLLLGVDKRSHWPCSLSRPAPTHSHSAATSAQRELRSRWLELGAIGLGRPCCSLIGSSLARRQPIEGPVYAE